MSDSTPQTPAPDTAQALRAAVAAQNAEAATPAKKTKKHSKRARHPWVIGTSATFSILLLLLLGLASAYLYGKKEFVAPGTLASDKVVMIPVGSSSTVIAQILKREGVIEDERFFGLSSLLYRSGKQMKAGEYLFVQKASLRDVLDVLIEGKAILHTVTLPEGLTSQQMVQRLQEMNVLSGAVRTVPPEGSLMPNTYKVPRGTSRESLVQRMAQERQRLLQDIWRRKSPDVPLQTPEELVILASIVEKETGKAEERPRVAAVFVNRLKRKMRLQSDPTIVYGLVGGAGTLGHGLTRSEIDRETPYNTYQIDGLPPTPIANPGKEALEAVANPARTNELFFVADGTGGHVFAASYEEHQRNVAAWREIERQRPALKSTPQ